MLTHSKVLDCLFREGFQTVYTVSDSFMTVFTQIYIYIYLACGDLRNIRASNIFKHLLRRSFEDLKLEDLIDIPQERFSLRRGGRCWF